MTELLKSIRLMGLPHMLNLRRGYKAGWEEFLRGYFSTHAIFALLNIGLIDELIEKRSVNATDFAARQDLDADVLESTCQAFYELRLFDRNNGDYSLSNKGRLVMQTVRGWLELSYGYDELLVSLEDVLRKKRVYGRDFYRRPASVARGSGEMEDVLFFPLAIDMIKQGGYRCVLDLGCGDGTFLRKLCGAVPEIKALGVDLAAEAVDDGNRTAEREGLSSRLQLCANDISKLKETPEALQGVQVSTVFFVLHELLYTSEQRVVDFLLDYKRLFPESPLIVFEAIRPPSERMRERPGLSIFYYYYHDLSHQKPTNREKWRELFGRAGFEHIEERFLGFASTSIFTLR